MSGAGTQRLLEAPILAAIARLAAPGLALAALFGVIAFGIALFGVLTGAAVHRATWETAATSRPSSGR